MLFYLDNWQSVDPGAEVRGKAKRAARGLNENYARELMELHTLGVDGGYSQKDVTEIARCFTGWTIRLPRMGGGFFFNQRVHDKGEKTVLGVTIKAGGGQEDGLKVLDILARHPATAKFISKKLAQRFVADEPPQKLLDKMAGSFRRSDGDIREVLKTMLNAEEFWTPEVYRAKVKSPFEMIASAIRATGAEATFAVPLINELAKLGQPLYRKLEPTGYSNQSGEWVNSAALVARLNFALSLAQNKVPGVTMDAHKFSAGPADAAHQLLGFDATKQTLDSIEAAWTQEDRKPGVLLGLLLGAPEFQRR